MFIAIIPIFMMFFQLSFRQLLNDDIIKRIYFLKDLNLKLKQKYSFYHDDIVNDSENKIVNYSENNVYNVFFEYLSLLVDR